MEQLTMGSMDEQFMNIIWEVAPVSSRELVRLSAERLGWKKSTMFTVLRRLGEKGLLVNENGMVRVLMSPEEFKTSQTENVVGRHFEGSLPSFIAAFTSKNRLSEEDIARIRAIIDNCGKED